ncbi:MAG: tryptophan 7-halogenase [Bacteroidota bacterium]
MMPDYDIIVVGAGVASAAALLALRNAGRKVAVLAPPPTQRFKIGETLAPAANQELSLLGLDVAQLNQFAHPGHSKFSAWGDGQLRESYQWEQGQQAGWYLDRLAFERWLWTQAEKTTHQRYLSAVTRSKWQGTHWQLTLKEGMKVSARWVLDGSGRSATVLRHHTQRCRRDKLVCCYCLLPQTDLSIAPTIATLVEPTPNGWCYSVVLPNQQLLVGYFTDADLLPAKLRQETSSWQTLLATALYTHRRITSAGYAWPKTGRVVDAGTVFANELVKHQLIGIGDAAASFDPLSSHGITTALWSGRRAAAALLESNESQAALHQYTQDFKLGITTYWQTRTDTYRQERRFGNGVFWRRRQ